MYLSCAVESFDLSLAGSVAPATRQWYAQRLSYLLSHFGPEHRLDAVTLDDLRRWRADLVAQVYRWQDHPTKPACNGGLSPFTIHGHIRAARRFFAWCTDEGLLAANPARRLEAPRLPDTEPKAISRRDLQRLLAAARESGERDYALVCFLADTGCRLGGLVGLNVADLDMDHCYAVVWEKGGGGEGKARTVYFGPETCRALSSYIRWHDGPVWRGRQGPLTRWGVYAVLKRLAKQAGILGKWNPHSFRHGWARHALKSGADLGTVSQVLGHSSIIVTHAFYGRWADDELGERARRFSPLGDSNTRDTQDF